MSETIVKALKNMSCPFLIQPHQIQGLDFPRLFPVIQWLVKIVLNFQQETAEFTKRQAALQFGKISKISNPEKIRDLNSLFLPKRKFKTMSNRKFNDPIRVYAALLEFGDATAGSSYQQYVNMNKENAAKENSTGKNPEKLETRVEKQKERISENINNERVLGRVSITKEKPLEKNIEKTEKKNEEEEALVDLLEQETEKVELHKSTTVIGRNIAKIVKSEDISNARNQYLDVKKEENPEILQKRLEKEREERLILTLSKEIEINSEILQKLQDSVSEIHSEAEKSRSLLENEKNLNERLKESIANLEENTKESRAVLQKTVAEKLEKLVIKRNQLKETQKTFKEKCNKEIDELNKKNDQDINPDVQE